MSEIFTEDRKTPIQAYLTYYLEGELTSAWQDFPTTSDEMEYNLGRSGIDAEHLTGILDTKYETAIYSLVDCLPRKPDLNELNELAHRLAGMTEYDQAVFGAVLDAGLHKGSLTKLVNLTYHLDHFDYYPGQFADKDFGGIMFEMHATEHWEARERLRTSDDSGDKAFAAYMERLEQSVDLKKYGEQARIVDDGILTRSGYLIPLADELPQNYTGPQDIPAGHRLTAYREERKPSLLGAVAALKVHQAQRDAEDRPGTSLEAPSGPEL